MTFSLINSNLPDVASSPFNLFAPIVTAATGQSNAPLVNVNALYKYGAIITESTELTSPNEVYNFYKITLPFSSVLDVKIDGLSSILSPDRLTGKRFYLDASDLYLADSQSPSIYKIKIEIPAPIPSTECEMVIKISPSLFVDRISYQGIPLNFGETIDNELVIDCSSSCCRLRGGELLGIEGYYTEDPDLIGQLYVFNINKPIPLIDHVQWRGLFFTEGGEELISGRFLWDSITQSLKLIL